MVEKIVKNIMGVQMNMQTPLPDELPVPILELFGTGGAVREVGLLMARSHPNALQYLEQAPILALIATNGRSPRRQNERVYIAQTFASAVHSRPKLSVLMARFGIPFPLRKMSASSIMTSWLTTFRRLMKIAPSPLSQAIPKRTESHQTWVRALDRWDSHMSSRGHGGLCFEWAAIMLGRALDEGIKAREIIECPNIADFAIDHITRMTSSLSFDRAKRATGAWHEELARRADHQDFLRDHGRAFDEPADYEGLPLDVVFHGLRFVALRSGLDLFLEGQAMRHCVSRYIREVLFGGDRIYSIRHGDTRIATAMFTPKGSRFTLVQVKGPCNLRVSKSITRYVDEFGKAMKVDL